MYEITEILRGSEQYPRHLSSIMAPPRIIWAMGNLSLLKHPGVSIVGARDASKMGLIIAERMGSYFSERGITVVSGLALGIDAAAHIGAVKVKGPTIAVLASGVDVFTPKSNSRLANEILEAGGLIVSEQPPGTPAAKQNFVPRNRIQVGLSSVSVIVECSEKSGTMRHAQFCMDEKHPMFTVIPENPRGMNLTGANKLVGMGAKVVVTKNNYDEVLEIALSAMKY